MKKIYLVVFMIAIGLFVVIYVSKKEYEKPITYDETKTSFQNKLMKYSYESNNSIGNTVNMYIIAGTEEDLKFDKITVAEGEHITLTIKKDEPFIISLPANKTVAAKWILKCDDLTPNNLILEKEEWLNTFKPIPKNSTGVSYSRQFFYFKSLSIKNTILKFEYAPNEKQKDDSGNHYFKFEIKVRL